MSTPGQRRDHAKAAANVRWATTNAEERKAALGPAARGQQLRFINQVDPDGTLSAEELAIRVENARAAHMARMRLAKARRANGRKRGAA